MAVERRKDNKNRVLKEGEYQRSSGTYEFKWRDKRGGRHSISATTLEKLREKELDVLRDVLDGVRADKNNLTINDLVEISDITKDSLFGINQKGNLLNSQWLVCYSDTISVCDLFANEKFTGNYTLWSNIDHAYCLKSRILREHGNLNESQKIIKFVNQYRHPELYINGVEHFLKTLDINIQSNLDYNSKAGARGWRLLKFELAIAYREA